MPHLLASQSTWYKATIELNKWSSCSVKTCTRARRANIPYMKHNTVNVHLITQQHTHTVCVWDWAHYEAFHLLVGRSTCKKRKPFILPWMGFVNKALTTQWENALDQNVWIQKGPFTTWSDHTQTGGFYIQCTSTYLHTQFNTKDWVSVFSLQFDWWTATERLCTYCTYHLQ